MTTKLSNVLGLNNISENEVEYIGLSYCASVLDETERCGNCKLQGEDLKQCNCIQLGINFDEELGLYRQTMDTCNKRKAYDEQQRLIKLLSGTGVGKRFSNRTFDSFEITHETAYAYQLCKSFCDNYRPDRLGLLLVGGYGCGKTHLAAAIINELMKKGICGVLATAPDLFAAIRQTFSANKDKQNIDSATEKLFENVKASELLVLDDLGAEKAGEWTREVLYRLINARYENMLPTIITTNCSEKELEEKIGGRTWSRICEMCESVMLKAGDYRMKRHLMLAK